MKTHTKICDSETTTEILNTIIDGKKCGKCQMYKQCTRVFKTLLNIARTPKSPETIEKS